jgi:cytochrome c oxidase subunit I
MLIKQRPHNLLAWTGLFFFLFSFLVRTDSTIDIHFHDTYFVMAQSHLFWLLAALSMFVWLVYLLTNRFLLSKVFTWTHVIITIFTLVLFASTFYTGDSFISLKPKRYNDFSNWNSFSAFNPYLKIVGTIIAILLLGQLIFFANFIAGIFKHRY